MNSKPTSAQGSRDLLKSMSRAASAISSAYKSEPDTESTLLIKKLSRRVAEHVFSEQFDSNIVIKKQTKIIENNASEIVKMKDTISKL